MDADNLARDIDVGELWALVAADRTGLSDRTADEAPRRPVRKVIRGSFDQRRIARQDTGAARCGRGTSQPRGGARRLSGIRMPRSPKSVRWRLGGGIPLDRRRVLAENPVDTLVVRAVLAGEGGRG
jgi:hypothetical protein